MEKSMTKNLISLANDLDNRGLVSEADRLDAIIRKASEWSALPKDVSFNGKNVKIDSSGHPDHLYTLTMSSDGFENNNESHNYIELAGEAIEFLGLETELIKADSFNQDKNFSHIRDMSEQELANMPYDDYFDSILRERHIQHLLFEDTWYSTPAKQDGYSNGLEAVKQEMATDIYYAYKDVTGSSYANSQVPNDLSQVSLDELSQMVEEAFRFADDNQEDPYEYERDDYNERDEEIYRELGYDDYNNRNNQKMIPNQNLQKVYNEGWEEARLKDIDNQDEAMELLYESHPMYEGKGRRYSDKHTSRLAKSDILEDIFKIANELDRRGLVGEADFIDKMAQEMSGQISGQIDVTEVKRDINDQSQNSTHLTDRTNMYDLDLKEFNGSFNCGPTAQQVAYEYELEVVDTKPPSTNDPKSGADSYGTEWELSIHRGVGSLRIDDFNVIGRSDGTILHSSGGQSFNSLKEMLSEQEISCLRNQPDIWSHIEKYKLDK